MTINPMQRKSRNSFLLGVIITLVICGVIIGILIFNIIESKKQVEQAEAEKQRVYVLTREIKSGEQLAMSDFQELIVDKKAAPASGTVNAVTADGTYAKIDMAKGTIITNNLIYEEKALTKDLRIQQYNMLILQKGLDIGNYIDIRFILPTGEDYLVVSRKKVVDVSETTVWIEMSEQETLTMSCAIYEAYIMKGSALYTTVYVEPGIQGNGDKQENFVSVTYPVTSQTLNLINSDPNVVNKAVEGLREERARIDAGRSLYSETALTNIEQNVAEQIRKSQEERKKYWDELNGVGGY